MPRARTALLAAAAAGLASAGPAARATQDPRPSAIVEQAESRLAQVDVAVRGPLEIAGDLGAPDFRLKVHTRRIEQFGVDRQCGPRSAAETEGQAPARPALIYVFYFDQPHLTLAGRARALDIARELLPRLLTGDARGMIVSNGRRLAVIEDSTADPARLLAGLGRLEEDRTHWDSYATEEESRVALVTQTLNDDDSVYRAVATARSLQREEHARADTSLRRLAILLTRLSQIEAPKAIVYFADTLRQNPGEHYVSFFGPQHQSISAVGNIGSSAFAAGSAFDLVLNAATAQGIRFYSVNAEGLVTPVDRAHLDSWALTRANTVPSSSRVRFRDAQNTLANMAAETGGQAFVRGETVARMAQSIAADAGCRYTLSFDPTGLPEDQPLRVIVELLREGVQASSRGRIVLVSAAARLSARLLSAFALGEASATDFGLRTGLVPTSFADGSYAALLQIIVPGTLIPAASWQLGATLIERDRVLAEVSGTLAPSDPGVPLVLEREITFGPGPHEIVAVAHEARSDTLLSDHLQVAWPDPNERSATCGPLALLQPAAGIFVRQDARRTSGSLARSADEPIDAALPTALMALVCRGRNNKGPLRVERSLVGQSSVEFPLLEFDPAGDRCVQVRDLIPAGSLVPGSYRYVIRVLSRGAVADEATRAFVTLPQED